MNGFLTQNVGFCEAKKKTDPQPYSQLLPCMILIDFSQFLYEMWPFKLFFYTFHVGLNPVAILNQQDVGSMKMVCEVLPSGSNRDLFIPYLYVTYPL